MSFMISVVSSVLCCFGDCTFSLNFTFIAPLAGRITIGSPAGWKKIRVPCCVNLTSFLYLEVGTLLSLPLFKRTLRMNLSILSSADGVFGGILL